MGKSLLRARRIFHVDMDAFFASVEQRDRPELRGRAVIVGGDGVRGVVAAASYEARRFGVRSAMPSARARKLCPQAVFVRPRHAVYREVSAGIFAIFAEVSEIVEGLSLDEAFLDVSAGVCDDSRLIALARSLKARISTETGLTASIGIADSKLVAKLASAYDKPDGLTWIKPDEVRQFLDPQPIRRIPGIGPRTGLRLQEAGILTIGQLRKAPLEWLQPV
ncbi:MAG: DNA polymerase IV, partial [Xanthomonadaceae bacterium]|nr:DNA polymerase IV [Xanthomonadaceae bacterium]